MNHQETQTSINSWAEETFGKQHPHAIAARMNVEVAELIAGLAPLAAAPVAGMDREVLNNLRAECADVYIMLAQVAALLGTDLQTEVDFKMGINRNRQWTRSPSGKMQHVEGEPA